MNVLAQLSLPDTLTFTVGGELGTLQLLTCDDSRFPNGVIYDSLTNKIVAGGFVTPTVSDSFTLATRVILGEFDSRIEVTNALEGTIIRLWRAPTHDGIPEEYRGKLMFSTLHRIDAINSKWEEAAPTFYAMFREAFSEDKDVGVEEGKCYICLLRNSKTHNVGHRPTSNEVIHLATTEANKFVSATLPGTTPRVPLRFSSYDEVAEYTKTLSPFESMGTLLTVSVDGIQTGAVRLASPGYEEMKDMRGGQKNMVLMYLEARKWARTNLPRYDLFRKVFTEKQDIDVFDGVDKAIGRLMDRLTLWDADALKVPVWRKILKSRGSLRDVLDNLSATDLNAALNMLDDRKRERMFAKIAEKASATA